NKNTLQCIADVCQTTINNIFKYPTKESKKNKSTENQNLEKLENTKLLFSFLHDNYNIDNFDSLIRHKELFNNIIDVFAKYPNQLEKIENELASNQKIKLDLSKAKELVKASEKINSQSTSSMSLKALDLYINEELKDDGQTLNQKFKSKIDENEISKFKFNESKSKYINEDCLDDQNFILSPTTKCSFRETLKVFNKILKRYVYNPSNENKQTYFIKNIVMEMPTEWNSVDERKRKTDIKNYNEECKRIVKEQFGYEGDDKNIIKKLVLFHLQNHIDVYSGESMDYQQIIDNPNYAEIDHIIPYSISYDDSNNNKVLVLRSSNQEKGRRTPKEYMDNKRFYAMKKKWEDIFLTEGVETYNKKKFENLSIDLGSDDIRRFAGFIGRNLADTRYACRIVKQAIDSWLDSPEIKNNLSNDDINIITVNGKYTQRYRGQKYLNIPKDREEDYSHHAVDATICAILGNSNENVGKLVWFRDVNHETGEVKSKSKFITLYHDQKIKKSDEDIKWNDLTDSVLNHNVKFSYKMHKKSNFGFWGDSIISVRKEKDIKGNDVYNQYSKINLLGKLKIDKKTGLNEFELLNQQYENGNKYPDPKLWKDLLSAYQEGKKIQESDENLKKENPFKLYMKKYCEINNLNDYSQYKTILLSRINRKGEKYEYSVSWIRKKNEVNSFSKAKLMNNELSFGAYTGMEWKEIRLFKDDKDKYRVIPMRINLYTNHLKNKINNKKYSELKDEFNISSDKFYKIHKGTLMINKNDSKDIRKIVGIDFIKNLLDIQEIYKKSNQNQVSINTIMENYYFCNVDELGNVTIIKDLGI
ncbi:MAG: type II CRISPR RNA-guided endonuclease Cas9, partial [Malacoplasma sp.]|nr:type II CRISPR RNA-guided endonuclease Cas9 [Malacoplasma sp.]